MNVQFPKRGSGHQLEAQSEQFFRSLLPRAWTCEKPGNDFGIDLRVGTVEKDQVTGKEFVIQLKATSRASQKEFETVTLAVSTYNYLRDLLNIAMLVKYVEPEKEAYWILVRNVTPPPPTQKTFTVRLPKSNRLTELDWTALRNQIQSVHNHKLRAGRP